MEEEPIHISKEFKLSDGLETKFKSKGQSNKLPGLNTGASKAPTLHLSGITPRICLPMNKSVVSQTIDHPSVT